MGFVGLMSVCAAAGATPTAEQVMPGVWRIRFGTPERLTPLTYRSAPSDLKGVAALPKGQKFPFDLDAIHFEQTA
jgi:hypothetical protein